MTPMFNLLLLKCATSLELRCLDPRAVHQAERFVRLHQVLSGIFHVIFELMRVFCEAEGARCVARARYRGAARFALVGGINTFAALSLQTALQA